MMQERLLGAAAGSIVTAIVVFDQRRSIYSSISGTKPESAAQYQVTLIQFDALATVLVVIETLTLAGFVPGLCLK